MHRLRIRWQDGAETEHSYERFEDWQEQCSLAQLLGAEVRFWSVIAERWTRWF